MQFYVKPIVRLGVQHWLAYATDATGRVRWQVTGMSEAGVRTACMRQQRRQAGTAG